jgi:hypothetical protein
MLCCCAGRKVNKYCLGCGKPVRSEGRKKYKQQAEPAPSGGIKHPSKAVQVKRAATLGNLDVGSIGRTRESE